MPLTDLAIKNAKLRPSPYKLADGGGLYLLVKPGGGRYWRLDYRFHDKRRTVAIGVYPEVSLADARIAREKARALMRDRKIDPSALQRISAIKTRLSAANTFEAVAEEYEAKRKREELGWRRYS
jgi:hypothetical protein